ncbi:MULTISPECIES: hypothetical protein [unclassified Bradyrhizobium]
MLADTVLSRLGVEDGQRNIETFALLLVQKITLVGLIKFLDHKGILGKDLIIEFLEGVAAKNTETLTPAG